MESIEQEVLSLKQIMTTISEIQSRDHLLLMEHDKILVRGNGVPSLQETVRVLSENLNRFIFAYEKERAEIKIKKEREEEERKDERKWWKRLLIGVGLPLLITFLGQAVVFWVKIAPMVENLGK